MGLIARQMGIGMLVGVLLVLPAYGVGEPTFPSALPPFLATVQAQTTVSRTITALFSLPLPTLETASASSPGPSATTKATTSRVVVKEGQSLWDIAGAHGVSVDAIAAANGLRSPQLIQPGQRLIIPSARTARVPQQAAKAAAATPAPAVTMHVVRSGDTLYSIARAYGKPVDTIVRENNLAGFAVIRVGQRLRIPGAAAQRPAPTVTRARGGWIVVQSGQTLSEIADANRTSVSAIVNANGLSSAEMIFAGQRLMIPGKQSPSPGGRMAIASPIPVPRTQAVVARISGFLWPARGVLTSRFGWRWRRHHDGIDIASPRGTPINAAKAGRIIFAGWYYGYGRSVIIDHGSGVTTLYGHASSLLVGNGQVVAAGQTIARVGCTGRCFGSHLHFEIRVNGRAVNPLKYF